MKTIIPFSPYTSSFSFSTTYFPLKAKKLLEVDQDEDQNDDDQAEEILTFLATTSSSSFRNIKKQTSPSSKLVSISKFNSTTKVIGTLFGYRSGHVHFSIQKDLKLYPHFLIEIPTLTSVLIREMASGSVRVAMECERKVVNVAERGRRKKKKKKLLEEVQWRSYCNGKKASGPAMRIECGPEEWKVLKAIEPITMGAGVLPGNNNNGREDEGELMYMRARFERVVCGLRIQKLFIWSTMMVLLVLNLVSFSLDQFDFIFYFGPKDEFDFNKAVLIITVDQNSTTTKPLDAGSLESMMCFNYVFCCVK